MHRIIIREQVGPRSRGAAGINHQHGRVSARGHKEHADGRVRGVQDSHEFSDEFEVTDKLL